MENGPFVRLLVKGLPIVNHHLGYFGILRVFRLRAFEEALEGQEGRLDGEDGGPGRTQGVQTDSTLGDCFQYKQKQRIYNRLG